MWWKKRIDLAGAVYFPGRLAPTLESLDGLDVPGLEVTPTSPAPDALWSARLVHPSWGRAELVAPRESVPLHDIIVDSAPNLSEAERARAKRAGACVFVTRPASEGDVLGDRKCFLRFLSAVLGKDGLVASDVVSQLLWTRESLDDELVHDAPLDIGQIHVLHSVGEGDRTSWVHSHGLAAIGFVDFDVLRPHPEVLGNQFGLLRSLAYAIVEGRAEEPIVLATDAAVELVPVDAFMRGASASDAGLRDAEDHSDRRVVACEPRTSGFFARLFGRDRPRPAKLFERGIDERKQLIQLSRSATELDALRARETLSVFERFSDDLAWLGVKGLVKVGYTIDDASSPDDREHLWFEVHGVRGDRIDATLINQPFRIARMHEGQRAMHDLGQLSDWTILTPLGSITARTLALGRIIAEHRGELEAALAKQAS